MEGAVIDMLQLLNSVEVDAVVATVCPIVGSVGPVEEALNANANHMEGVDRLDIR